jgi:hypothetical protein
MSEANVAMRTMSVSDEARILAEQFLNGVKSNQKSDVPEPDTSVKKNLLIGIPAYGGCIDHRTVSMLLSLSRILDREGIPHTEIFVANESLIPRARNFLGSAAAFSRENFSHLVFVDADISFQPEYVLEMLKCGLPIAALPYSRKGLNWRFICEAARHGIGPEHLVNFGGAANIGVEQSFEIGQKPVPVIHAATGAMCIDVNVFKALTKAHEERRYRPNGTYQPSLEFHWDFFPARVRKGVYLSEDYAFCEDAAELGFQTYVLPAAKTFHQGSFSYPMDLSAVSAVASVLEQKQVNAAQAAGEKQ